MVEQASGGSKKCVEIATQSSVKEMILPGIYAVLSPAVVGMLVGTSDPHPILDTILSQFP